MHVRTGYGWLAALGEGTVLTSLLLTGNPTPQKSITRDHVCFRSFSLPATATFLLLLYSPFFPWVISSPSLVFFKWVLLPHCYHQAWRVWPRADVCVKARTQDLPVGAGRRLLAALPCPWRQVVLQLNTCSQPVTNSWCQNRQKKIQLELSWCAIHRRMNISLSFQERLLKEHTRQWLSGAVLVHWLKI